MTDPSKYPDINQLATVQGQNTIPAPVVPFTGKAYAFTPASKPPLTGEVQAAVDLLAQVQSAYRVVSNTITAPTADSEMVGRHLAEAEHHAREHLKNVQK